MGCALSTGRWFVQYRGGEHAAGMRRDATAVIVAYNHPSEAAAPSPQDKEVTNRREEAGRLLRDIGVWAHHHYRVRTKTALKA